MFLILRKICSTAQRLVQAQRLVHLPYQNVKNWRKEVIYAVTTCYGGSIFKTHKITSTVT